MRLYTSAAVAEYLGLTERRVRQLRDQNVLPEARPGLWELKPTIRRYIEYLRGSGDGAAQLNAERAGLTKAKREAAELELQQARKELHRTDEIKLALMTEHVNFRNRMRLIPQKRAATLADMTDRGQILAMLQADIDEALEEMSDFDKAFAALEDSDERQTETENQGAALQGVPVGDAD